jgi:VanZ family protein
MPRVSGLERFGWLGIDKWVHFGLYFMLCFAWSFENSNFRNSMTLFLLIGVLIGGGIELLQFYLTNNRSAEWGDFFADVSGLFVANFIATKYLKNPSLD